MGLGGSKGQMSSYKALGTVPSTKLSAAYVLAFINTLRVLPDPQHYLSPPISHRLPALGLPI